MSAAQNDHLSVRSLNHLEHPQSGQSLLRRQSQTPRSVDGKMKYQKKYESFSHYESIANNPDSSNQQQFKEGLSQIMSAPRSKKVYIYTGVDEFKPTTFPINDNTLSKLYPKESQQSQIQQPSPNGGVKSAVNKGILKRKIGQDSMVVDDSAPLSLRNDSQTQLYKNVRNKEDVTALTTNVSAAPTVIGGTPGASGIKPKQSGQSNSKMQLIKPTSGSKNFNDESLLQQDFHKSPVVSKATSFSSQQQQQQQQQLQLHNSNSKKQLTDYSKNQPQISQFDQTDQGVKPLHVQVPHEDDEEERGEQNNRRDLYTQTSLLIDDPLINERSDNYKRVSSYFANKIPFQNKSARTNTNNQEQQKQEAEQQKQINVDQNNSDTERAPNQKQQQQQQQLGSRSLFYQLDDIKSNNTTTNFAATPLMMNQSFTTNDQESHKFVHTQSYLKRRIDNLEKSKYKGSMPMLNEVISDHSMSVDEGMQLQQQSQQPSTVILSKYLQQNSQNGAKQQQPQSSFVMRTEGDSYQISDSPNEYNSRNQYSIKHLKQSRRSISQTLSPFRQQLVSHPGLIQMNDNLINGKDLSSPQSRLQYQQEKNISTGVKYVNAPHLRYPNRQYVQIPEHLLKGGYQLHRNIPLAHERLITDPFVYTHQVYQRSNMQRQNNQNRVISLLEEQDKIMEKIIEKYKARSNKEEANLKQKLTQLQKDREQFFRLKSQEQHLGMIKANLHNKLDSFKSDSQFYNEQLSPKMPELPVQRYHPIYTPDLHDLVFLDSIIASQQTAGMKNRHYNHLNYSMNRQKRSQSQMS